MDLSHDFIKPSTPFLYRYRKCMYCNKIKTFKAVYKCKDCTEVCHRDCHTKFVEIELKHNKELEHMKSSTIEINDNEIVARKSVHEIGEKKGEELQNAEKEQHKSFLQTCQEPNTSLAVNILQDTHKIESNGVALGQGNFTPEENKDTSILNTDIQYKTGLDINENELEKVIDGTESN